jgi:hypothetical protein
LLRKLEFFRDTHTLGRGAKEGEDDEHKKLSIDIQQYFNLINLELKSHFLELAFKHCFEDKEVVDHLRLFLRSFRFPLRIIYTSLLQDLVVQSKQKLIKFLKAVPEILPYSYSELPEG